MKRMMKRFCSWGVMTSLSVAVVTPISFAREPDRKPSMTITKLLSERLSFAIKKLGITLGHGTMAMRPCDPEHGTAEDWCVTVLITSVSLRDEETIVIGRSDFLPKKVFRSVDVFGRHEDIVETYDQTKGKVTIVKTLAEEKQETTVIEKEPPIENVYGFLYRLRASQEPLKEGQTFVLRLPLVDVTLRVKDRREIRLMGQKRVVFEIRDQENRYNFWVEDDDTKRPWRIDGPSPLGTISMRLKDIETLP